MSTKRAIISPFTVQPFLNQNSKNLTIKTSAHKEGENIVLKYFVVSLPEEGQTLETADILL